MFTCFCEMSSIFLKLSTIYKVKSNFNNMRDNKASGVSIGRYVSRIGVL